WPPLVEVVDTWELPPVLIDRYNAAGGEGTALCGIFPEIRRAWASDYGLGRLPFVFELAELEYEGIGLSSILHVLVFIFIVRGYDS
ncbi:hypothetical protein RJ639_004669, partial [Escallonia herrerae]